MTSKPLPIQLFISWINKLFKKLLEIHKKILKIIGKFLINTDIKSISMELHTVNFVKIRNILSFSVQGYILLPLEI